MAVRATRKSGTRPDRGRRKTRSRRFRIVRGTVLGVALVAVLVLGSSLAGALLAPGTDPVAARVAEWGRNHGLGWAISGLEKAQYTLTKPKTGGSIAGGLPKAQPVSPPASAAAPSVAPVPTTAAPASLPPIVTPAIAGEGAWQNLYSVKGLPAARVTFLRPDTIHTSYYVQVVWMDPKLVRFSLHPGYQVPGGPLTAPNQIPASELSSVLATFNSGFLMTDARGGYWQNGRTIVPLRTGAASMVLSTTGSIRVEAWPGGTPGAGIAAVRQNLDLLVSNGQISPAATQANASAWGATVGNLAYVWRSAIGIRADGSVVSVVGPALDVQTLAGILKDAGAVTAMELDINPDWTNYIVYKHPKPDVALPSVLPPANPLVNPDRYLQPSSRDFVEVLPR